MLYRVIGTAGSGKTEYLLSKMSECLKNSRDFVVIVPEQLSVEYELLLCNRLGNGYNMHCEVLNFERLPNRVSREYGGLAVKHIERGGEIVLLSVICEQLKDELIEYSTVADDTEFAKRLYSLIGRFKMSLITPEMVEAFASDESVACSKRLRNKLRDIAGIYREYNSRFGPDLIDPADALTSLANELDTKQFFKGKTVFVDSYYTFTNQEYAILERIIDQSRDTYISFTYEEDRSFFEENEGAAYRLKKAASRCEDVYLGFSRRSIHKDLLYLEKNYWRRNADCFAGEVNNVKIVSANDRFDEVEAAAAEILKYIRSGKRFGDVFVVCRNTDNYNGIVDSVFASAEIPCYRSKKEAVLTKPLFSFLTSSLSVIIDNFSCKSIKRCIKSGYTDLNVTEADVLISYAESWNIRGKSWYSDNDWAMDPEGFREGELTDRGRWILTVANRARHKVIPPLSALKDSLSSKDLTVRDGLKALYNHLISCGADRRLCYSAEKKLSLGLREDSERELALWRVLINLFDQLDSVCGDFKVTPKRLLELIKLAAEECPLGAIPASADSVTFGDVSLIRAGGSGMLVILGLCDGEFPAAVGGNSFFDRDESLMLEQAGCEIAENIDKLLSHERFLVYSALASPKEKLVLLYPKNEIDGTELRPSVAVSAVKECLPTVPELTFSESDRLYAVGPIASYFPLLADGEHKDRIKKVLKEKNISFYHSDPEVCNTDSRVVIKQNTLNLSPSKYERYSLCPFSYFGKYLLSLTEKKRFEWTSPDTGTFVHRILELFMKECLRTGVFICPDDNDIDRIIDELADRHFRSVANDELSTDKRFIYSYGELVEMIKYAARNICREFAESKFTPSGFEFSIGLGPEPDMPAISYDVDGKTVYLRGSIDRVDTYTKDGFTYVRVTDYKTYSKSFSMSMVEQGLDTQLLHYLFAYCNQDESFVPAGVLYFEIKLPDVQIEHSDISDDTVAKELQSSFKRSGIVIDDVDIIRAMSESLEYVPVKLTKNGEFYKNSRSHKSKEEFYAIAEFLNSNVRETSRKIFSGDMDIRPVIVGNSDPCKYCKLKCVCRFNGRKEVIGVETD